MTCNYLPESASRNLGNKKNSHKVQDIVSIWYLAARKLCVVVDSQIKIWSCALSYKNCNLTLWCHPHNSGTILIIFTKLKYYFDFDKLAIILQPIRFEDLCHFPNLIEKYHVLQLIWFEKSQNSCWPFHFRKRD